ncbi:GHMP kinase [Akkermansiaceae bacterium]|nr:GHMP kinase [Akkermansiaceae bacterium]
MVPKSNLSLSTSGDNESSATRPFSRVIRATSHPRAGLIGNPSDGFHGKAISFIVRNFKAEVTLWGSPELVIEPNLRDQMNFGSIGELVKDTQAFGYYGGLRLLKASVKRFHNHCSEGGLKLHSDNFTIRYHSDIPAHVGLAGSSAIITACFRALMSYYEVQIPAPTLANLVLSVETEELRIPAGLQDRVIQAYEGVVFMDFAEEHFARQGYGEYEELDPVTLPSFYIAYRTSLSEGTEIFHNDLRGRFNRAEPKVLAAMEEWADLAQQVRDHLLAGQGDRIPPLINRNFDLRRETCQVSAGNLAMIEAARALGASAKFTGSGGAIIGTYEGEEMFNNIRNRLAPLGAELFKPQILGA